MMNVLNSLNMGLSPYSKCGVAAWCARPVRLGVRTLYNGRRAAREALKKADEAVAAN
jgi:hypothetical protein